MRDGHSPTDFLSDTNSRLQAERSRKVPSVRFQTVRTLGAALIRYMYYFFPRVVWFLRVQLARLPVGVQQSTLCITRLVQSERRRKTRKVTTATTTEATVPS